MSRLPGCLCGLLLGLLLALPAGARAPALLDVRYQYDAAGNPTAVTVAGQTRRQAWDALGRLQSQSDALDQTTTYGYDAADAPTRARAPNGAVTTWTPDGFAQPLGETSPDRGSTQYGYDAAGNLTRRTDARGAREETTYDASNRPLERRFYRPDGTLEATHTYTWDRPPRGIGRLDRLDAGPNRIAFDYDLPGHPVGRTYARAGVTLTVQTAHDPVTGLPDTLTYPAQSQLQYRYDTLGRIAAIHWDGQPIADQLQYTAFGALAAARLANGLDHRRTHDAAGRIASYTLAGETTRLTRDAAGQIVALTPAEPGRQQQFGYDAAGRLISYQDPARTERYTYDASGNRLTRARDGQTTPYRYTPNSNRLQTLDALAVAHDAAGNRLSDPTRQYAHDSAGRLVQLQQGATLARYEYNGLGERALKQLGAELRHFVYDERGHLLGEYDTAGRPLAEYAWLGDLPVAYRVYRQVGGLPQTELYTVEADHLGTPRALTDAAQRLRWRWVSAPFGDTPPDENPQGLGAVTFNLRFPGQYYDAESGLHYNYFRDYDPNTGRYVQSDPIGLDGGLNTYLYADANPVQFIDPEGLSTLILPRPIIIPRPVPMPTQPVDPVLPIPDIDSFPGGTPKDPFGEYCRSLARRITNTRDEIYNKRYPDLQSNPQGLPHRIGPGEDLRDTVRGHEKLLNRKLRELRKLEDEYAKQCVPMACL